MSSKTISKEIQNYEHPALRRKRELRRELYFQRQDSWTGFKGTLYKVASTVVLPRNMRGPPSGLPGRSGVVAVNMQSISTKSLPSPSQISASSYPPVLFGRSISVQNQPRKSSEECKTHICNEVATVSPEHTFIPSNASTFSGFERSKNSFVRRACNPFITSNQHNPIVEEDEDRNAMELTPSPTFLPNEDNEIYHEPSDDEEGEDSEDEEYSYSTFYSCMPPPVFMLIITALEVGFFIYHAKQLLKNPKYGYVSSFSPAPLDSILIYNPTRRFEVWRYFTYAFVHSGYMHVINNVVLQLVLGILLEMVHGWRVLVIYFSGILAGSLATSISQPYNYLAGASAGVYSLITAHLSTVILNWSEMEYPSIRIIVFFLFVLHDAGIAIYFGYFKGITTNVGFPAHFGGAVAGLLVGVHVLKNLHWSKWEKALWWICAVACILLFLFAIGWNVFRSDLYP